MLISQVMSAQDKLSSDSTETSTERLDSIEVSLVTCTPGRDMYAKFGHTALRVRNYTIDKDVVFNYGCFDYNSNNFVLKFLLGQTDYLLDAEPFDYLKYRYSLQGNGVTEQVLNLTQPEANKLLILLLENLRPENQEYRYNWLYDNCTERARDVIEKAVDGEIEYANVIDDNVTVREMLRNTLKTSPWISFGIDMILGDEIDKKVDARVKMFLPTALKDESDQAYIVRDGGEKISYVIGRDTILEDMNEPEEAYVVGSPLFVFILLLICTIWVFAEELKRKRLTIALDVVIHMCQGAAGLLVAFLFFFSEHPAVDSNWLVIIFNPIPLLYAGWVLYCHKKKRKNYLSYVNLAVIAGFLATMAFCPQSFNLAMWLLVSSLLVRALSHAHFAYHSK